MDRGQKACWGAAGGVIVCAAGAAWGQRTIHVATCGNNAWSGLNPVCQAPDGPKATVAGAVMVSVDGDTVLVADGEYAECLTLGTRAITIRSAGGPGNCRLRPACGFPYRSILWISGPATVEGFRMSDGFASPEHGAIDGGGAIRTFAGASTVRRCIFDNNWTVGHEGFGSGGAILVSGGSTVIAECIFINNRAGHSFSAADLGVGGALAVRSGSAEVTNCVFANNSARAGLLAGRGGAAYVAGGSCILTNCTIVNNYGDQGGATWGNVTVRNSILWANTDGCIVGPCTIGPGGVVRHSDVQGGFPGVGNINVDPMLVVLPDGNRLLSSGSPCIDAGDSGAVPAGVTADLTGLPRFQDDPATPDTGVGVPPIVDMGANEFPGNAGYANCDGSSTMPVLNAADFVCFQMRFAAGDRFANCDGSAGRRYWM